MTAVAYTVLARSRNPRKATDPLPLPGGGLGRVRGSNRYLASHPTRPLRQPGGGFGRGSAPLIDVRGSTRLLAILTLAEPNPRPDRHSSPAWRPPAASGTSRMNSNARFPHIRPRKARNAPAVPSGKRTRVKGMKHALPIRAKDPLPPLGGGLGRGCDARRPNQRNRSPLPSGEKVRVRGYDICSALRRRPTGST